MTLNKLLTDKRKLADSIESHMDNEDLLNTKISKLNESLHK
jgi:hypothetical protein